jgi:hypothetical protein
MSLESAPAAAAEAGVNLTGLQLLGIAAVAYVAYRGIRAIFAGK